MKDPVSSQIHRKLSALADENGLDIAGGIVRRSSSRFCLGVEHGDYNGSELFGVGTNRFIWLGFKPNDSGRIRIFSGNFPEDGLVDFKLGEEPPAGTVADSWARFPYGVSSILRREGYALTTGFDAVLYGNIPGGGMSRSASLCLNLLETFFEVNQIGVEDGMRIVDLAQMVENDYIGSPCGKLDQVMIYFAKAGMGTYYNPRTSEVDHYPFGGDADSFRIVSLDTGTKRPGLEKSTYKVRREECSELAGILGEPLGITQLADVSSAESFEKACGILRSSGKENLIPRVKYLFEAQLRFGDTLEAWKAGDIRRIGQNFRADGIGLRDDYQISGKELETMCDIARSVPGVFGERMLGGGDKGASGALVETASFDALEEAVIRAYPLSHPAYLDHFAVHGCKMVDGMTTEPL